MIISKKQKWITLLAALALVLFAFFGFSFVAPVSAAGEWIWEADTEADANVFKSFPGEEVEGQRLIGTTVQEDTNLINWGFATGYAAYGTVNIGNGVGVKYEFIEPIDTAELKSMTLEFYHVEVGVKYYLHPLTAAPFSETTATQAIVTKGGAQAEDIALDLLAEDNGIVKGFILEQVRGVDSTLYLDSVTPHTKSIMPSLNMWKADTKEDANVFKSFPGEEVEGQRLIGTTVQEDTNLINWGFATGYAAYGTVNIGNGVGVKYEFIEPIDTAELKSMTLEFYHVEVGVKYYLHPLTAAPFSYATATQAIVTKGEAQAEDIALDLLAEDNGIVKGFILEQVRGADSTLYLDSVTPHAAAKIPAPFAQKVTVSFDKKTPGDVSFNVKLSGAALTLKNGAEALIADTDYTVAEDTITVKQSYLMNMPKGQDTVLTAETVGGNLVLFISVVDSRTYIVNFYNEDGKTPFGENVTVMSGSLVAAPETDPTKAATAEYTYKFDGWYNGETEWNFETDIVTGDLNLVAKFASEKNSYKVTLLRGSKVSRM